MQKQPPEMVFEKKAFLKISQNLQKNMCLFLIKLQAWVL